MDAIPSGWELLQYFHSYFILFFHFFFLFIFLSYNTSSWVSPPCAPPSILQKTCSQCSHSPVSEAQLYSSFMSLSLSKILVLASLKVVNTLDMLSSFPEFSVCLSVCSYLCPSFLFTFSWLMFIFSHVFQK